MNPLEKLQAVVLMGGLGTRLASVSGGRPKGLMPVAGKPFFEHPLGLMKAQGFRDFLFLVGYGAEAVRRHFGDGRRFGVRIRYSFDGPEPIGTGAALRKAARLLGRRFALVYGDSFLDVDFAELLARFEAATPARPSPAWRGRGQKDGLMAAILNRSRREKSNVLLSPGRPLRYDKARPSASMRHIDYGVSILDKSFLRWIPAGKGADLAEAYRRASAAGRLAGAEVSKPYHEIGSPAALAETEAFLKARSARRPAVFVDRDGTLNELDWNEDAERFDSPFKPERLRLAPGAAAGLKRLRDKGYLLIGITNQPGAAKGKTTLAGLYEVNTALRKRLASQGADLDDLFMCPHHPEGAPGARSNSLVGPCDCRKPAPGLVRQAMKKYNIDQARSYVIGDSHVDVETARAAGLKAAFIGPYKCESCRALKGRGPDLIVRDLDAFSRLAANVRDGRTA